MKAKMEATADVLSRLGLPNKQSELLECPACDTKLTPYEVAKHCEQEVEQLQNMRMKADAVVEEDLNKNVNESNEEQRKPWTIFQRVQKNRHSRLKVKNIVCYCLLLKKIALFYLKQRLRKRPIDEETTLPERNCPMCNKSYPQCEIEKHAEACLRRSSNEANGVDNDSSDDDGDGEQYEEYEWAGQKRIRVSSLLQGGYAALGIGSNGTSRIQECTATDEEEDLNVDEDDTHIYGPAQYNENDIPTTIELNGDTHEINHNVSNDCNGERATFEGNLSGDTATTSNTKVQQQIIDSLKAKLRQYEKQLQSKFKCLICLDDYRNPAISVSCWHVHCEECWLRSLGARKLCPRCNLITTPKDLRRIYM